MTIAVSQTNKSDNRTVYRESCLNVGRQTRRTVWLLQVIVLKTHWPE